MQSQNALNVLNKKVETPEELLQTIKGSIKVRFKHVLTEEERQIIRSNRDTEYAKVMRKLLGPLVEGLQSAPATEPESPIDTQMNDLQ